MEIRQMRSILKNILPLKAADWQHQERENKKGGLVTVVGFFMGVSVKDINYYFGYELEIISRLKLWTDMYELILNRIRESKRKKINGWKRPLEIV